MTIEPIQITALIGIFISIYAFYTEKKSKGNSYYKPICDINNKVSCSKAFESKYSRFIGISNTIWGILYYTTIIILSYLQYDLYILYLTTIGIFGSVILAYVLYFKVQTFCIVCNGIYLINIILFIMSFKFI